MTPLKKCSNCKQIVFGNTCEQCNTYVSESIPYIIDPQSIAQKQNYVNIDLKKDKGIGPVFVQNVHCSNCIAPKREGGTSEQGSRFFLLYTNPPSPDEPSTITYTCEKCGSSFTTYK